jgi:cysteine-rich repeat protein
VHPSRLAALALACSSCRMLYHTAETDDSTSSSSTSSATTTAGTSASGEPTTSTGSASAAQTSPDAASSSEPPPGDTSTSWSPSTTSGEDGSGSTDLPDAYAGCAKTPDTASESDPICSSDDITPDTDNELCDADCTVVTCGDNHVNGTAGEQCDGGDACDEFCRHKCGNGRLDASPPEECDDGNTDDGDACSSTCTKSGLLVFVSSGTFTGNFEDHRQAHFPPGLLDFPGTGIDDANMVCLNLAATAAAGAGLPWALPQATTDNHGFGAWLSNSDYNPSADPQAGFHKCDRQYFLPIRNDDNTYTFEPVGKLFTQPVNDLAHPIDHTESGLPITVGEEHRVWTNTLPNGDYAHVTHCNNWSDALNDDDGVWFGNLSAVDSAWTLSGITGCAESLRIYCFEQCPSDPP